MGKSKAKTKTTVPLPDGFEDHVAAIQAAEALMDWYKANHKPWTIEETQLWYQCRMQLLGARTDDKATGMMGNLLAGYVGLLRVKLGYVDQADSVTIEHHYHAPATVNEKGTAPDDLH